MCKVFVCLLHCAVKSVTFFVYNNAGLNFTSTLFCFDVVITNYIVDSLRNMLGLSIIEV